MLSPNLSGRSGNSSDSICKRSEHLGTRCSAHAMHYRNRHLPLPHIAERAIRHLSHIDVVQINEIISVRHLKLLGIGVMKYEGI